MARRLRFYLAIPFSIVQLQNSVQSFEQSHGQEQLPSWMHYRHSCFELLAASDAVASFANDYEVDVVEGSFDMNVLAKEHWGRRPMLFKQGWLQKPSCWPDWAQIVDLVSREEIGDGARLVTHVPGKPRSFDVEFGPFDAVELNDMLDGGNERCATLLLNDVDRVMPALADWMDDTFGNALPRWRRDDAQISLASLGGGIGPHVDNYDVFLIQTAGTRTWQVGTIPLSVADEFATLVPHLPVRILDTASLNMPFDSLTLEAGDSLYLPPRFVHWGTSTSADCVTLSVGCRAPSPAELASRVAERLLSRTTDSAVQRFQDPLHLQRRDAGEPTLTDDIKTDLQQLVLTAVKELMSDSPAWDELVGCTVTEPKRFVHDDDEISGVDAANALQSVLNGEATLQRSPGVSLATSEVLYLEERTGASQHECRLFANGRMYEASFSDAVAVFLCIVEQGRCVGAQELHALNREERLLVEQLMRESVLRIVYSGGR